MECADSLGTENGFSTHLLKVLFVLPTWTGPRLVGESALQWCHVVCINPVVLIYSLIKQETLVTSGKKLNSSPQNRSVWARQEFLYPATFVWESRLSSTHPRSIKWEKVPLALPQSKYHACCYNRLMSDTQNKYQPITRKPKFVLWPNRRQSQVCYSQLWITNMITVTKLLVAFFLLKLTC